jgi:ankyrin repeat protein
VLHGLMRPYPRWTLLHIALCSNRTAVAELFLSQDPMPPMASDPGASTALHAVSKTGNLELARRFIDMGHIPWVNKRDWRGYTPIMYAFTSKQLELARYPLVIGG